MASEGVNLSFLQDQVHRLNAVLAEYQRRYPAANVDVKDGAVSKPWLTDADALMPLLAEYDANLEEAKQRINSNKREFEEKIKLLVNENERLHRELASRVPTDGDSDRTLLNVQEQLTKALRERDAATEMYESSMMEVEALRRKLQGSQVNPRVQAIEMQAHEIKDQCLRSVTELNHQVKEHQEELKRVKNELKVANIQVVDLRRVLEEQRIEMISKEQARKIQEGNATNSNLRIKDLNKQVTELQTELISRTAELDRIGSEKNTVEQRLMELHRQTSAEEARSMEAVVRVRESQQVVDNANLERDQALIREKMAQEEAGRLQDAISKLVDEAGARTRLEVDSVKKQCNQNLTKLMEELQRLELETSEKQAQLDRALREKRAAESELEHIYQEGVTQGGRENSEYHELTQRACNAERARDETQMKIDSLSGQIRRMELVQRQEKSYVDTELEALKDRCSKANEELNLANDDRLKLTERVDELMKQLVKVQQEKETAIRNTTKQLTTLQHERRLKEKEYEVKLQSMEDGHRHASQELRQMLTAQQIMSAKWKEECNNITQKLEMKFGESKNELTREKQRNEELSRLLRQSRDTCAQTEAKISEYQRKIQSLENRIYDAEQRSTQRSPPRPSSTRQNELNILELRKQQQRELEHSFRQSMTALNYSGDFSHGSV